MDALDWFLPHQANLRLIQAIVEKLGFPMSKTLVNIDRYGNTSAASIPIMMAEAVEDGRIQDGHTVLTIGFGAGFTWGVQVIRWGGREGR
jgi:3-oxoacyl-[acyl-carrier-protein] synthase III